VLIAEMYFRHRKRKSIPLHFALFLHFVIIMLFAALVQVKGLAATTSEAHGISVMSQSPPEMKMHIVRRIGKHSGYSVDVRYPYFIGGRPDAVRKLNRLVKRTIDMNIPNAPLEEDCFGYRCNFEACLVTPKFISLRFDFDNDTGGASGDTFEVPLNVQLYPDFKLLKLKDVLGRKKINYLKLAGLCLDEMFGGKERDERPLKPTDLSAPYFEDFTFDRRAVTFILPERETVLREIRPVHIQYKTIRELIGSNSVIRKISSQ
jgi:hypothetical protein